jgi:hypothetical protein
LRGAALAVAFGVAFAAIVYVATGGHVFFLPLVFVPLVFFWPRRPDR